MAGGKKGKAYEAFIKTALEGLKAKKVFKGDIFWDEMAEGLSIIPDLTIGTNKDKPHTVILITHSGSAKNSDMKYWRNMGELAETKTRLSVVPKVFNIAFDSVIKENLKKAQEASFDGQLLIGDQSYGTQLQKWIDDNLSLFPKDKHEKVEFLHEELKTDKVLQGLMISLKTDLEGLLKKRALEELEQIWEMERSRSAGRAPRARKTSVRRGLSKILIFEDSNVAMRLFGGKRVKSNEVPDYAYELGLATKFTAGGVGIAKAADEEILNAVATLGESVAKDIITKAPIDKVQAWLTSLRNSSHMVAIRDYLIKDYASLIKPGQVLHRLELLHRNPNSLIDPTTAPINWPPKSVWLFEVLLEIPKLIADDPTSYGYAQLERDCEKIKGMPKAGDPVYRTTIPGWVHRRTGVVVPTKILTGISAVLARILSTVGEQGLPQLLSSEKLKGYADNIIEAKLCTYRGFEPLRILIENAVTGTTIEPIRSCFGEKAALPGQATKTTVLRKNKTLINWQSAQANPGDKTKELCGRAVALRYSWNTIAKKFIKRSNTERLILLLDGTWKREDLLALARAGWDEIFYPDEMEKLAKAIV